MSSSTLSSRYHHVGQHEQSFNNSQKASATDQEATDLEPTINPQLTSPTGKATTVKQEVEAYGSVKRKGLLHGWSIELACCLLFLVAFVAIFVTLLAYENKRIPEWRYGLSLNTLIAIYVIILKASMLLVVSQCLSQLKWLWFQHERKLRDLALYDDASRGPWGSIKLLWHFRSYDVVTSLGALITIGALVIDPFAQQIISSRSCTIEVKDATASLNIANAYIKMYYGGASGSIADLPMQKAINAGIFNPGSTPPFRCDTGNCTFTTPYHTLGYCSTCADMTSQLIESFENITRPNHFWSGTKEENNTITWETWIYTLPMQSLPQYEESNSGNVSAFLSGWDSRVFMIGSPAYSSIDIVALTSNKSNIVDVRTDPSARGDLIPVGARCSLVPCIRTCTAVVRNFTLAETVISSQPIQGGVSLSVSVNPACLSSVKTSRLAKYAFQAGNDTNWPVLANLSISANGTFYNTLDGTKSTAELLEIVPRPCLYGFNSQAELTLTNFLSNDYLTGNISDGGGGDIWNIWGPGQLLALYNMSASSFNSLNEIFSNMSDSMTTQIRVDNSQGDNGVGFASTPTVGQTWNDEICVQIRWAFITYPAVVISVAIVFFFGTIVCQRSSTIANWKSSQFALLFHGLDRSTLDQIDTADGMSSIRQMEVAAKDISVSLQPSGPNTKLVSTHQDVELCNAYSES